MTSKPRHAALWALALLLLAGCSTSYWTERTNVTRELGPEHAVVRNQPLADAWYEMVTDSEADGFEIRERLSTDTDGRLRVSLLPVALQALAYQGDVVMRFYELGSRPEAYTSTLTVEQAREVIREWQVQVRLGSRAGMRRNAAELMDSLIATGTDADLVTALREIRGRRDVLPAWR
jgi:hypothetical protein